MREASSVTALTSTRTFLVMFGNVGMLSAGGQHYHRIDFDMYLLLYLRQGRDA